MKFQESSLSVSNFADMGLSPQLLAALDKAKLKTPTPIQSQATPPALAGTDVIGIAQTGSGKTLAYALAALTLLEKDPKARVLVLTPSRETAEQIHRVFMGLTADKPFLIVLAATGVTNKILNSQFKKNPRLIVATPGRLEEHVKNNKALLQNLALLVIDEADRMLDLGFEKQLKFIQSTLRGERQTLLFAANFGGWAEDVAKLFMKPDTVLIRAQNSETPVESLHQKVFFLSEKQKNNRLRDELRKMKGGVIIFAESQESCNSLGRFLEHHEFSSDFVHGDMNAGHRNRVLREFREQKFQILITTDLLARGLDIEHINHVVNYELPYKADDFLHRIGRTARAGREGSAITFITPGDDDTYRRIKKYLAGAIEENLMSTTKPDGRSGDRS